MFTYDGSLVHFKFNGKPSIASDPTLIDNLLEQTSTGLQFQGRSPVSIPSILYTYAQKLCLLLLIECPVSITTKSHPTTTPPTPPGCVMTGTNGLPHHHDAPAMTKEA